MCKSDMLELGYTEKELIPEPKKEPKTKKPKEVQEKPKDEG